MTFIHRSRIFGFVAGLSLLCGCSMDDLGSSLGLDSANSPAVGVAVGDEPFAVRAGVSILNQGGDAADAAAAIYFALGVTYPVSAGLGGGGICILHDARSGQAEEFDFLSRDAARGGAYAVPAAVRGFAALQAAYGTLPWQRDVAPAEALAASGFPISLALAQRLAESQDVIRLDAALAKEFLDESGQVKKAGTIVSNPDLSATLAAVRTQGADGFYKGPVAAAVIAYAQAQGGAISSDEWAGAPATRHGARALQLANQTVYLPGPGTGAGAFAGALFDNLNRSQGANDQTMVVEAVKQALSGFGVASLPKDMGSTGFAVVDAQGQAVSCAVTMNGPFGSGHSAGNSGVVLARAPSSGGFGLASAFLTPVLASDEPGGAVTLAGAGAGGPNGTAAIAYGLLQNGRSAALLGPGDFRSTGAAPYETVNIVNCRAGTCVALDDPGANGMGAAADTVPAP